MLERLKAKEKGTEENEVDSITGSMHVHLSKPWEVVEDRGAWCATVQRFAKSQI